MKSRAIRFSCNFVVISLLVIIPVLGGMAVGQGRTSAKTEAAAFAKQKIERLRQVAKTLHELADQPPPANLSTSEQDEAKRHCLWLINSSGRLNELADRWQAGLNKTIQTKTGDQKTINKNMQDMNQSFNMQYLGLQQQMQDESRRFTLLSNIMKNRHDTAKNSINNLR